MNGCLGDTESSVLWFRLERVQPAHPRCGGHGEGKGGADQSVPVEPVKGLGRPFDAMAQ